MLTTLQIIEVRGPQYAADPRLSTLIALAAENVSVEVLGDDYNKAIAYKVLHMLTLEAISAGNPGTGTDSGTLVGGVDSVSEGDLSKTFTKVNRGNSSSLSARNEDMSSTQFGKEYLAIIRSNIVTVRNRWV